MKCHGNPSSKCGSPIPPSCPAWGNAEKPALQGKAGVVVLLLAPAGPELLCASVCSSMTRERSYPFYLWKGLFLSLYMWRTFSPCQTKQIDIIIIYLYKMQIMCHSFIKLFYINIFILSRPFTYMKCMLLEILSVPFTIADKRDDGADGPDRLWMSSSLRPASVVSSF